MSRLYIVLKNLLGLERSIPSISMPFLAAAAIALLQIPTSYIMLHFNLSLGIVLNEFLIVLGIPLCITFCLHFDQRELFSFKKPSWANWIFVLVITLGIVVTIDYITAASEIIFPLPSKYKEILDYVMTANSPSQFAHKILLLCLIPGVCEEIFFRGFCQTTLAKHKGNLFAIIVTAALFALLHGNIWQMHLYFILGCFLSWTYAVSKTLWVPIVCHILNNTWTFSNHVFDTTPPFENASMFTNGMIMAIGIMLAVIGGMGFVRGTAR